MLTRMKPQIEELELFRLAYTFLLDVEGGYSNHDNDKGRETYKGISRRWHPSWKGWNIIDDYKRHPLFPGILYELDSLNQMVEEFYKLEYWDKAKCGQLPVEFAIMVFGSAVNHDPRDAVMLLQQTVRTRIDGSIGPKTIAALNARIGQLGLAEVVVEFLGYRAMFYHSLVRADSSQADFLRGWFNRLFKLQQFVLGA